MLFVVVVVIFVLLLVVRVVVGFWVRVVVVVLGVVGGFGTLQSRFAVNPTSHKHIPGEMQTPCEEQLFNFMQFGTLQFSTIDQPLSQMQ